MQNLNKLLIVLAAVAFVLAVLGALGIRVIDIEAEGYSFASTNLTLLAIAIHLVFKN